jgi:hypothetical protein
LAIDVKTKLDLFLIPVEHGVKVSQKHSTKEISSLFLNFVLLHSIERNSFLGLLKLLN